MTLSEMIFIFLIIVFVLILIFFPESRVFLSGLTKVFFKDMASTPEGAEAIYEETIAKAQEKYNIADNALRTSAGKHLNAKNELAHLNMRLKKVETACEDLVKRGDIENAKIKAEEREEILSSITRQKTLVEAYANAEKEAREVHAHWDQRLKDLRKESKETIENMRMKKELEDVYDNMDELKNVTATDKLLDHVREKNKDLNASVEGARVVHNNKLSTKIQKADAAAKKAQSNDYLDALMKKHNK